MIQYGTLTITPRGRLMLGGHAPRSPELDDGTARRPHSKKGAELPFLPGSALKGALRETYTRLLLGAGEDVCRYCREGVEPEPAQPAASGSCPICRLFGAAGPPSLPRLRVRDAELLAPEQFSEARHLTAVHHVSVDRGKRTRARARLFGVECLAPFPTPELVFQATVELVDASDEEWERLRRTAEQVLAIGAGRSGGQGRVEMRLEHDAGRRSSLPAPTGERRDYVIKLEVHEAVCLGSVNAVSNFIPTESVIPGSTIRGAIAHALLDAGVSPDAPLFKDTFRGGSAARFVAAFPTSEEGSLPRAVPETALECKRHGIKHGLHDALLLELLSQIADLPLLPRCPDCGGKLTRVEHPSLIGAGKNARAERPCTVAVTRVALSRSRGRAASGLLYTQEQIQPGGVRFVGQVRGLDRAFEEIARGWGPVPIGKGVARGGGLCRFSLTPLTADPLERRVEAWKSAWAALQKLVGSGGEERLPLPLLATTSWPLQARETAAALLGRILEVPELEVAFRRMRHGRTGRYVVERGENARDERTPLRSAVRPGGVLVIWIPEAKQTQVLARLVELEASGLVAPGTPGYDYDRECGLGGVRVADPFHVENGLHRHVLKQRRG